MPQNCGKIFDTKKSTTKLYFMKKTNTLRALLGITQAEAAMLFKVTRSQWSMFELGLRDLPLAARTLLAEALAYMQALGEELKEGAESARHEVEKKGLLETLLRENEYQFQSVVRKMDAARKKYKNSMATLQLTGFFAQKTDKVTAHSPGILQKLVKKASKALSENSPVLLMEYELKKEALELERLILDSSLRKLSLSHAE